MKKLEQLWQTFLSVVKILLQSKWRTHLPSSFSNPEELLILANGPSLNRTVREAPDFVQGKTLLVIAHRLSTIADADQIIVVNHGKIEATGTQAELLASCPLYQTMWKAHISVKDDGEVA